MSDEKIGLIFQTVKESRGPHMFVQYTPASENMPFASLVLVYTKEVDLQEAAKKIEEEARMWFCRYPVPLVACAVGEGDDALDVSGGEGKRDLLVSSVSGEVVFEWGRLGEFKMPPFSPDPQTLLRAYSSLPHSTLAQRKARTRTQALKQRAGIRLLLGILFVRRAVVPAVIALAFYLHPVLGFLGLLGALADAAVGGLRVLGYLPKSKRELAEEERRRRMEHHDYHCRLNPIGFAALKAENLGASLREDAREEARRLHGEASGSQVDAIEVKPSAELQR
ncbi:MAG TPA: hypothetical protein VM406_14995 [Noviherbaspirillum sp.]|nr:hypothetical protein [Noviherbaspirillum sp.]